MSHVKVANEITAIVTALIYTHLLHALLLLLGVTMLAGYLYTNYSVYFHLMPGKSPTSVLQRFRDNAL